jgi:3-oxoacyl-[acyl-carrier protein] reductase
MNQGNGHTPFRLDGRVALVTGGSTGLGKAMVMALGAAGAKVALNYRNNQARAEKAFAEFQKAGHSGKLYRASAVDEAEIGAMVKQIEKELGAVDILVINATPAQPQKPIELYDSAASRARSRRGTSRSTWSRPGGFRLSGTRTIRRR